MFGSSENLCLTEVAPNTNGELLATNGKALQIVAPIRLRAASHGGRVMGLVTPLLTSEMNGMK